MNNPAQAQQTVHLPNSTKDMAICTALNCHKGHGKDGLDKIGKA